MSKEGADLELTIQHANGQRQQTWHFPSRAECMVCHSRAAGFVLGLSTNQMNRPREQTSRNGELANVGQPGEASENQLAMLQRLGLVTLPKPPDELERLVSPADVSQSFEARAKSYLHSNCAICHIDAGGGNSPMLLEFTTAVDKMKLIDAIPVHDKFGLADARLVAPGDPERSVLLHRIARRGRGQMPQLGTNLVDQRAVELISAWIRELPRHRPPEN